MQNKVKEVAPLFNRCVIFNTDLDIFHGNPEPLNTPPDITRKSIALYKALPIANDLGESHHTNYVARYKDAEKNIADVKKLARKRDKHAKRMFGEKDHWLTNVKQKIKDMF